MRFVVLFLLSALCSLLSFASAGTIDTIAGNGKPEDVGQPFGVEIGPDGALIICEVQSHRVRRLDLKTRELTTVAGSGQKGYAGDGGPATKARLNEPYEVRFDKAGNMLFVEMKNYVVRKVDAKTGTISTVAGTGELGFGGDGGPAIKAQLNIPHSIALDADDNLYIADIGNHRIRKVDAKSGIITTIAGSGERKQPTAGQPAAGKPMIGPRAPFITDGTLWIAIGPDKGIYVVDTENHAIRRIDAASGKITTLTGRGPQQKGGAGDGGPATEATLDRPHGIGLGNDGAVYIGDTNNHRVRRIRP